MVIKDLARNTIISVYEEPETKDVTVGRYDADPSKGEAKEMGND